MGQMFTKHPAVIESNRKGLYLAGLVGMKNKQHVRRVQAIIPFTQYLIKVEQRPYVCEAVVL